MISQTGPIFATSDTAKKRRARDKKPKGFADERSYSKRLQDALNTFEIREITDRVRLQNFWCSFIKQPKSGDVPVIEAYAILSLHNPELFRAKVWTYKDDLVKNINPRNVCLTQAQISQRTGQIPDFVTQARYDITPVEKWAIDVLPTI